ncbi:class I SAM-dependent methyltransferase [Streptomyces sp. NPDC001514]
MELGPGTGAFSTEIQHRLAGRGRHLAIEVNPVMAEVLTRRYPRAEVVVDDATRLANLMAERGLSEADLVVSGLPFAAFDAERQRRLIGAVASCMGPTSAFTAFGYSFARLSPPAVRFRRLLGEVFEEVVISRTVWRNVPPAFVYSARRPRETEVQR